MTYHEAVVKGEEIRVFLQIVLFYLPMFKDIWKHTLLFLSNKECIAVARTSQLFRSIVNEILDERLEKAIDSIPSDGILIHSNTQNCYNPETNIIRDIEENISLFVEKEEKLDGFTTCFFPDEMESLMDQVTGKCFHLDRYEEELFYCILGSSQSIKKTLISKDEDENEWWTIELREGNKLCKQEIHISMRTTVREEIWYR